MKQYLRYLMAAVALMGLLAGCKSSKDEPVVEPEKPQPEALYLEVTPSEISVPVEGMKQTITVSTNAPSWQASMMESATEWAHLTITTGLKGETTTQLVVDENTDTARRVKIFFTASGCEDFEVMVTQAASTEEIFYGGELYIEPDDSEMGTLTARELVAEMGVAWNLGNSLEVPSGETGWGNVATTQELISYVKELGFKTVRIPTSWLCYEDGRYDDYHIRPNWFARVSEVIDYCLNEDMYVILNEHWDNDAFNNLSTAAREEQLKKAEVMWRQIAVHFRDYDHRVIFAGFNENTHNTSKFGGQSESKEYFESHNLLLERFVKTVRETGGRNTYRYLAVQGYNTNIDQMVAYLRLPNDSTPNRLLVECHYYTPWPFCGQEQYESWIGGEAYMYLWDMMLPSGYNNSYYRIEQMVSDLEKFGEWCETQGVGAILGEYAAAYHGDMAAAHDAEQIHQEARAWWHYNVARLCNEQGICPALWDNGDVTTTQCAGGYVDRVNLTVRFPAILNAIHDGFNGISFAYHED